MEILILCPECQIILDLPPHQSCLSIVSSDKSCQICANKEGLQEFDLHPVHTRTISRRVQQIRFVHELMDVINRDIIKKIIAGKIPDEWNGIELRRLIADKAKAADYVKWTKEAEKEYANAVLNNNL